VIAVAVAKVGGLAQALRRGLGVQRFSLGCSPLDEGLNLLVSAV